MMRVLVVGNATVDVIQRVERFARPGETLLCSAMVVCAGGKGLNQAIAAARTGTPTRLHASAAADTHGELLARAATPSRSGNRSAPVLPIVWQVRQSPLPTMSSPPTLTISAVVMSVRRAVS